MEEGLLIVGNEFELHPKKKNTLLNYQNHGMNNGYVVIVACRGKGSKLIQVSYGMICSQHGGF